MANGAEWDLGEADTLEAEAIGLPGQRRFRLRVSAGDATAAIWCEKEHVSSLATAIQQQLARRRQPGEGRRPPAQALSPFPDRPTHEFQLGQLGLEYNPNLDNVVVYATDVEQSSNRPTLRFALGRQAARRFTVQAEQTVAGGRPTCPLCQQPLEGSEHLCPRRNGHGDGALAGIGPPDF